MLRIQGLIQRLIGTRQPSTKSVLERWAEHDKVCYALTHECLYFIEEILEDTSVLAYNESLRTKLLKIIILREQLHVLAQGSDHVCNRTCDRTSSMRRLLADEP
jgi:hypothetical protein